jgi:hypothetical protein
VSHFVFSSGSSFLRISSSACMKRAVACIRSSAISVHPSPALLNESTEVWAPESGDRPFATLPSSRISSVPRPVDGSLGAAEEQRRENSRKAEGEQAGASFRIVLHGRTPLLGILASDQSRAYWNLSKSRRSNRIGSPSPLYHPGSVEPITAVYVGRALWNCRRA